MSRVGSMVGQLELKWKVGISLFSARKKENVDGEINVIKYDLINSLTWTSHQLL